MEQFKPVTNRTIQDLETLQVVADPLRAQIFELLAEEPLTVRQVGERLGLTAGRLYYHFNLLEKHDLIRVVETRTVANMLEKLYRASARSLELAPGLLDFSSMENRDGSLRMLASIADAARDDLLRSIQARLAELDRGAPANPRQVMANRAIARLTSQQAGVFLERVQALIAEFEQAGQAAPAADDENRVPYAMTVIFNPSFYYREDEETA